MAHDEKLGVRIDAVVRNRHGMSTTRMLGSIGWMLNGRICVGIWNQNVIVLARAIRPEYSREVRRPICHSIPMERVV
jgi:hypothetical protein